MKTCLIHSPQNLPENLIRDLLREINTRNLPPEFRMKLLDLNMLELGGVYCKRHSNVLQRL